MCVFREDWEEKQGVSWKQKVKWGNNSESFPRWVLQSSRWVDRKKGAAILVSTDSRLHWLAAWQRSRTRRASWPLSSPRKALQQQGSLELNVGPVLFMWVRPPSDNLAGLSTLWMSNTLVLLLVSPLSGILSVCIYKGMEVKHSFSWTGGCQFTWRHRLIHQFERIGRQRAEKLQERSKYFFSLKVPEKISVKWYSQIHSALAHTGSSNRKKVMTSVMALITGLQFLHWYWPQRGGKLCVIDWVVLLSGSVSLPRQH